MKITGAFIWKFGFSEGGKPVQFTEYSITPAPAEGTGSLVAVIWEIPLGWMGTLYRVEPDAALKELYALPGRHSEMAAKAELLNVLLTEANYERTNAPKVDKIEGWAEVVGQPFPGSDQPL